MTHLDTDPIPQSSSKARPQKLISIAMALALFAVLLTYPSPAIAGQAETASELPALSTQTGSLILFSGSHASSSIEGAQYRDEDIVSYDPATGIYDIYFDGSSAGVTRDLDGFEVLDDGSILMTFDQAFRSPDLGLVDDSDILRFHPEQLGAESIGVFEWFLDGSDVGLTTSNEDIDSIAVSDDGRLIISTHGQMHSGSFRSNGQDLVVLNDPSFGQDSAGNWSLYLDGSDVQLQKASERLRGASTGNEGQSLYLSTLGRINAGGVVGSGDDIVECVPGLLGEDSSCSFSLFRKEMVARYLDGLHVGAAALTACAGPLVKELSIESHSSGELVDTSGTGLATGSFILAGLAPPETDSVDVAIAGEVEPANLETTACGTAWEVEVAVMDSGVQSIDVAAGTPSGDQNKSIELDLVAASSTEELVQPAFATTPQHEDKLVSFNSATGELVFAGDIGASLDIDDGLVGDRSALAPDGYLRIVESISFDGVNTVVGTRQAGLTEMLRRIDVSYRSEDQDIDPIIIDGEAAALSSQGVSALSPDRLEALNQSGKSSASVDVGSLALVPVTDPDTELDLFFNLDPGIDLDLDVDWGTCGWFCIPKPQLERLWFEGSVALTAKAELTHTKSGFTSGEVPIGQEREIELPNATIFVLGFPVHLDFEIEYQAFYELSLTAALQVEYELGIELKAGFEYNSDGSGRGGYRESEFIGGAPDLKNIKLGPKLEFSIGVEMDFEILLYGQVGFELEARPQLVFEAIGDLVNQKVDWELKLEVPFAGGIEVEIKLGPIELGGEFANFDILTLSLTLLKGEVDVSPDDPGDVTDDVVGDGLDVTEDDLFAIDDQWGKVDGFIPDQPTWVLSTGLISDAVGNPSSFASTGLGQPGNPQLSAFVGLPTFDAAVYSITAIPSGTKVKIEFIFASEEYPEYVGSQFNDVMAIFVNGENCALVPGTSIPVSVNSVNENTNSQFFIDNTSGASGLGTAMDGLTTPLLCEAPVTPGEEVTIDIAVADTSDGVYDSAVALVDGGISSE